MKKRTDGRYCKQVQIGFDYDGKRLFKNIYGKTIKEVEKKEREIRTSLDSGIAVDSDNILVGAWADKWLKTFKIGIAHNTYARYEGIIKNYIKPLMGEMRLKDVRLDIVQYSINKLSQELSSASVKKFKDALHQIFEQALKMNYVSRNPVDGVEMPKFIQKPRMALSDDDVLNISEFCGNSQQWALIMTLLYTGMRRGEVLALTKEDVDIAGRVITVNKAVEFINGAPKIKTPKTEKGNRKIPILDPLLPYLKPLVEKKNKKEPVFCNSKGTFMGMSTIRNYYGKFLDEYNKFLKQKYGNYEEVHFTMHQFRHTFCTILYKAGVDVKTSQELLGHSSVNVTLDIYTHLDKSMRKINTDKINIYLNTMCAV